MTVRFHPGFPEDLRRIEGDYAGILPSHGDRFRLEADLAIAAIRGYPTAAGHFVGGRLPDIARLRRRNLRNFPFFILYDARPDDLRFLGVIAKRSDPRTWKDRLSC